MPVLLLENCLFIVTSNYVFRSYLWNCHYINDLLKAISTIPDISEYFQHCLSTTILHETAALVQEITSIMMPFVREKS
jgi:hypothetical protein